jgi:hypothetical protein
MTHSSQFITLDEIIRKTLGREGLTTHYYVPFLLHAKEGMNRINFHSAPEIKISKIAVTDNKFEIPTDTLKVLEVFELRGDRMNKYHEDEVLAEVDEDWNTVDVIQDEKDFIGDTYQGGDADRGTNFARSFAYIKGTDQIRIKQGTTPPAYLWVKYISNIRTSGLNIMVHPMVEPCIIDWVKWKWAESGTFKRLDAALMKRNYDNSMRIYRANKSRVRKDLIKRLQRKAYN